MRSRTRLIARAVLLGLVIRAPAAEQDQVLLPLDETDPTAPLLPAGISQSQPEVFGNYVYLWALDDRTHVMQYEGDFALHLGERRLRSREAVIWMTPRTWEGVKYYSFEVVLAGEAQVRDTAGTLTTGVELFVTFNSAHPPVIEYDAASETPSADTKLYQRAERTRQALLGGEPAGEPAEMAVVDFGRRRIAKRPEARPMVRHRADEEKFDDKRGLFTATGNVYVSQGLVDSGDFLELRADEAVLFLAGRESDEEAAAAKSPADAPAAETEPLAAEEMPPGPGPESAGGFDPAEQLQASIAGVYLRGDVVLSRGERVIRAAELYYDFENDRALILDAVMRAMAPERNVPVYVRADRVRQLSSTEYLAHTARISTSEFYTPHVHIGADRVYLTDTSTRDDRGRVIGLAAGRYRMHDVSLNLEGVPVTYWPYTAGDFRESETTIRRIRMGYSDDFGATFESQWYLFNLIGLDKPEGVDATLRLDYRTERGPGVGIDADYEVEDAYGLFRGYYINDHGDDELGPLRSGPPDHENRGRLTWRHRQFLPKGWELTLEGSYISDPNFMDQYFRGEFENGKEQETVVYLKKQKDNWAFSTLANWRLNDFFTRTEHLPMVGFDWAGQPLGEIASYYNQSSIGWARFKPDNRRRFNVNRLIDNTEGTDMTFRVDSRNEVTFPIKLGSANEVSVVPYAMGRGGHWDGSPREGSLDRLFGSVGVKAGSQVWRLFEGVESQLLDIHDIRHIIKPELAAWLSCSNRDSSELHPFDESIERINDFYGTSLALRQRWQTKRGGPGQWRTVDWIVFDIELNLFGNPPDFELPIGRYYDSRPEQSNPRNHIRTDFLYRISDTTALLSDGNIDLNDGDLELFNVSYAVERTPRFSYALGYRRIHETDSNLIGGGINYKINVKHRVAVRLYYDLQRGETERFDITLLRKFPRWYAALTFAVDNIEDNFSVNVSVWPEGAPNATIGPREYTSLAQSTGIRPEKD